MQACYGRSSTNWFHLIVNPLNSSRDLARLRGRTTDDTNARTCHFFCHLYDHVPVRISTARTFTITFYEKKKFQTRTGDFGVQFFFKKKNKKKRNSDFMGTLDVLICNFSVPFFSGCPSGWSVFNVSCYKLSSNVNKQTFSGAVSSCKATPNAYLVEIQSPTENGFVAGLLSDDLWIGYSDQQHEGTWLWNSTGVVGSYTNWHKNEPNNAKGNQDCALIWGYYNGRTTWDDRQCDYQLRFVCERGKWQFSSSKSTRSPPTYCLICSNNYVAGECVDLLDDYDFPPGTITEMAILFSLRFFLVDVCSGLFLLVLVLQYL